MKNYYRFILNRSKVSRFYKPIGWLYMLNSGSEKKKEEEEDDNNS